MEPSNESISPGNEPEIILNGEATPRPGARNKGGRPKFVPTEDQVKQVKAMCMWGTPHHHQARVIGISIKTFIRAFRKDLDLGQSQGVVHCFGKLHAAINAGEQWAIKLYLANTCGWHDTNVLRTQQLGADGKPINPNGTVYVIKKEELKLLSEELDTDV